MRRGTGELDKALPSPCALANNHLKSDTCELLPASVVARRSCSSQLHGQDPLWVKSFACPAPFGSSMQPLKISANSWRSPLLGSCRLLSPNEYVLSCWNLGQQRLEHRRWMRASTRQGLCVEPTLRCRARFNGRSARYFRALGGSVGRTR